MTDEEIEEQIRSTIEACCPEDIRDAVIAWFDKRMIIARAVIVMGLDLDQIFST
jgi:hypothetical protein